MEHGSHQVPHALGPSCVRSSVRLCVVAVVAPASLQLVGEGLQVLPPLRRLSPDLQGAAGVHPLACRLLPQ